VVVILSSDCRWIATRTVSNILMPVGLSMEIAIDYDGISDTHIHTG
jgi:hypothetical protein